MFKIRFSLTTINLSESDSLRKILYTSTNSMGTLHLVPLIFENSPFLYIIAIFLNKILLDIIFFKKQFKFLNSQGRECISILLETAWPVITIFKDVYKSLILCPQRQ